MKKIPIEEASEIDYNAFPLYYENGAKMLNAGVQLNDDIIALLERQNISSILVFDEDTQDINVEKRVGFEMRNELRDLLKQIFLAVRYRARKNLELEFYTDPERNVSVILKKALKRFKAELGLRFIQSDIYDNISALIQSLPTYRKFVRCPVFPRRSGFWYADHCIDVTLLSLLLARRCGFLSTDQRKIALGTLFHDIGFALYPENEIEPFGAIGEEEEKKFRNHTVIGYALLRLQEAGDLVTAQIPYGHHEKQDGSGYPRGIKGTNRIITNKQEAINMEGTRIHRYAELMAVANTYDRSLLGRPEDQRKLHDEVIEDLERSAGTTLNKEGVESMVEFVPKYPVASPVRVQDGPYEGYRGIVSKVPPDDVQQPIVRLLYSHQERLDDPVDVDLREEEWTIECTKGLVPTDA